MIKLESLLNENNAVIKKQSIQLVKDMVKFKGKLNQYQMADIKKLLTLLKKIKQDKYETSNSRLYTIRNNTDSDK